MDWFNNLKFKSSSYKNSSLYKTHEIVNYVKCYNYTGGVNVMKKYLLALVGVVLFLVACGNNDNDNFNDTEAFLDDLEDEVEEKAEEPTTDDPLEFVEKGKNGLHLIDGANEYEAKNYYVTDDTNKDGFNIYEDGDFEMRYAIIETENVADVDAEGNKEIQVFGEIINDTEDDYYFDDGTVELKTDEGEESELSFGFNGAGTADQKSKFIDGFSLEYGIPDSFTLKVLEPTIRDFGEAFEEDTGLDEFEDEEELEEYIDEKTVIDEEFHKE